MPRSPSWVLIVCALGCGNQATHAHDAASGGGTADAASNGADASGAGSNDGADATGNRANDGAIVADGGDAADSGAAGDVVSHDTLNGLLVMGYQGWFTHPGAPSGMPRWVHWSDGKVNAGTPERPAPGNITFDAWPDLSEFADSELRDTSFTYANGETAGLYSAATPATVDRHMKWAQEYGIDGVFLQRFLGELSDPTFKLFRDTVTRNIREGAEAHGRVFAIEYDISGANASTWLADLKNDWQYMVDTLGVTGSDRYLHHRGKPLVVVWGLGFTDRPGTAAEANALLDWFSKDAPAKYRATIVGGVPTNWRTLTGDSKTDPAWAAVYRRFAVIHPWLVGRYKLDSEVESFVANTVTADLAEAKKVGADYLPVIFPGFSWFNLKGGSLNQIPRRGGAFWWKQFYEFTNAGCTMAFGAMFDEVDEGTAMFKIASKASDAPAQGSFLTLDADGLSMSSDFYLRLAGAGARVLHGQAALSTAVPIPLKP